MQSIFEKNLQVVNPAANKIEEKKVNESSDPLQDTTGKHKIDLLDGADDEDADEQLNMLATEGDDALDEEERQVR